MGRITSSVERLDLVRERERIEEALFEPQLRELGLGSDQIEQLDLNGLRSALERVNEAIANPNQFGTLHLKITADVGVVVAAARQEGQIEVGILPLLLRRKQLILTRLRVLAGQEQVTSLRQLVGEVADPDLRASLAAELSEFERSANDIEAERQSATKQIDVEEQKLTLEMTRQRFEVERFERRSVVWQRWFERESIATIIGAVLLLILVGALLVAMFTSTEVPEPLSSAFLLILGYFFGQAASRSREESSPT